MVINGVKQVCALDGLEYKKELLQLCREFLRKHNYPPGNPQTQLFNEKATAQVCWCGEEAIGEAVATNGWQGLLCQGHYEQSRDARLLRRWKKT